LGNRCPFWAKAPIWAKPLSGLADVLTAGLSPILRPASTIMPVSGRYVAFGKCRKETKA